MQQELTKSKIREIQKNGSQTYSCRHDKLVLVLE